MLGVATCIWLGYRLGGGPSPLSGRPRGDCRRAGHDPSGQIACSPLVLPADCGFRSRRRVAWWSASTWVERSSIAGDASPRLRSSSCATTHHAYLSSWPLASAVRSTSFAPFNKHASKPGATTFRSQTQTASQCPAVGSGAQLGLIAYWILLPLAVLGAVFARRRRRPIYPLLVFPLIVALSVTLTIGAVRYRAPARSRWCFSPPSRSSVTHRPAQPPGGAARWCTRWRSPAPQEALAPSGGALARSRTLTRMRSRCCCRVCFALGDGVLRDEGLDGGGEGRVVHGADPGEHPHDAVRGEPLVHLVPALVHEPPGERRRCRGWRCRTRSGTARSGCAPRASWPGRGPAPSARGRGRRRASRGTAAPPAGCRRSEPLDDRVDLLGAGRGRRGAHHGGGHVGLHAVRSRRSSARTARAPAPAPSGSAPSMASAPMSAPRSSRSRSVSSRRGRPSPVVRAPGSPGLAPVPGGPPARLPRRAGRPGRARRAAVATPTRRSRR